MRLVRFFREHYIFSGWLLGAGLALAVRFCPATVLHCSPALWWALYLGTGVAGLCFIGWPPPRYGPMLEAALVACLTTGAVLAVYVWGRPTPNWQYAGIAIAARVIMLVAMWLLMTLVAVLILTIWDRSPISAEPGRCRECGYDLRGNMSGRCPECGLEVAAGQGDDDLGYMPLPRSGQENDRL